MAGPGAEAGIGVTGLAAGDGVEASAGDGVAASAGDGVAAAANAGAAVGSGGSGDAGKEAGSSASSLSEVRGSWLRSAHSAEYNSGICFFIELLRSKKVSMQTAQNSW